MSNLVDYAEQELAIIGMGADTKDPMNKLMHDNIIDIVKKFSKQGDSGFSAGYALSILNGYALSIINRIMSFEPVTPLTGSDDEWVDVSEVAGEPMWQNKRSPRVFKRADGTAYDVEGKVFVEKGNPNNSWTSSESKVDITFPYTPKREYVEVER